MQRHAIPVDMVAEDEMDVHLLLENWARWCKDRSPQGRASSAEGRYQAKAGNVFADVQQGVPVDPLAGEAVNEALIELPMQHREALSMRYFKRLPDFIVCRKLHLRATTYSRFLSDARNMLRIRLLSKGFAL